jgi:hypothetical protein
MSILLWWFIIGITGALVLLTPSHGEVEARLEIIRQSPPLFSLTILVCMALGFLLLPLIVGYLALEIYKYMVGYEP